MKRIIALSLCLSLCFSFAGGVSAGNKTNSKEYVDAQGNYKKLLWSDHFLQDTLDTRYWDYEYGSADNPWSSRQFSTARPENIKISNGFLDIKSQISFDNDGKYIDGSEYTGSITTKNKFYFKYGEIEVKAKFATGDGVCPVSFLMGKDRIWPKCGEIDLFEFSNKSNRVTQALHTPRYNDLNGTEGSQTWGLNINESKYHIFKTIWLENSIEFYIDGQYVNTYQPYNGVDVSRNKLSNDVWPFDQPMYLVLRNSMNPNLAGDRSPEGWTLTKTNEDSKDYETHTYIDYVKVYTYAKDPNVTRFEKIVPKIKSAKKKYKSKKLSIKLTPPSQTNKFDGLSIRLYKSKKKAKNDKKYFYYKKINKYKTNINLKLKRIKNKKNLYVKIRYFKEFGNFIYYSKFSKIKKVKIKK